MIIGLIVLIVIFTVSYYFIVSTEKKQKYNEASDTIPKLINIIPDSVLDILKLDTNSIDTNNSELIKNSP